MDSGARNTQPNIILITSDQQRWDTVGEDRPAFLHAPHTQHLCDEGIRFTRAYADQPVCVPSRVQIMTGQSVFRHGMFGNGRTSDVMGHTNTLPSLLHAAGYHTCAIGKMHFTPQRHRHGFDEMILPDDYYRWMARTGYPYQPMRHGLGNNEWSPSMATVPESLTLTNWIAEQCVSYIRDRRDPSRPFFLWCSFSKPHPPLDPPEPYWSMYQQEDLPAPAWGEWTEEARCPEAVRNSRWACGGDRLTAPRLRRIQAAYYGLITQIDYAIGRVLAALQDEGLLAGSLIVCSSDHGEMLGDFGMLGKSAFFDASAKVPLIVRPPRGWTQVQRGVTCDALVGLNDLLPTLVRAGGGEMPADVDGRDLFASASSDAPREPIDSVWGPYGNAERPPQALGITDGRWKYLFFPRGGVELLFDTVNDPRERHDLNAERSHGSTLEALRDELIRRHTARGSPHVDGAGLRRYPPEDHLTAADWRATRWAGYHTETFDHDVRH